MTKMNVLVTGSNGFIGSHTVKYLKEKECYVIGMGRKVQSTCNVDQYISCDVDSEELERVFQICSETSPIQAVVHLAADMRKEPFGVEIVSHNCVGTQRLLEQCEQHGVNCFVQISSLPVIGKPIDHPITENHPIKPPTVYHATKVMEELLANYADYHHGLRTISFRISAPVGPRMNYRTIFPTFVKNAMENKDLILSGRGTRKQSYVHVSDIAQAIYLALTSKNAHGVYNLSSKNLFSNYALAQKCVEVLHSKSQIKFSGQDDYMDDYCWDVSLEKIHRDLGYEPRINIERAICELAEYMRNNAEKNCLKHE